MDNITPLNFYPRVMVNNTHYKWAVTYVTQYNKRHILSARFISENMNKIVCKK